jgi:hypothetical protein
MCIASTPRLIAAVNSQQQVVLAVRIAFKDLTRNQLRAVLFALNLFPPEGEAFGQANREWWEGLDLPASEKLRVRHDLHILDGLEPDQRG